MLEYDAFHYQHQMPGGMLSNFKSQLAEAGLSDRFDQLLEEVARVREVGLPDHDHALCAIGRDPGGTQRGSRRAISRRAE